MMTPAGKVIVECPSCGQLLNTPGNRRKLRLTCPKCRTTWIWAFEPTDDIRRLEVRPRAKRNAVFLGIMSLVFAFTGLGMLVAGEQVLAALLATAFGAAGLYVTPKMWKREVSMILTPQGLEQCHPSGNALIPWRDIEGIGVMSVASTNMVGIRLRSYDRYLNGMSAELAAFMMKSLHVMKLFARGASIVHVHGGVGLWLAAEQHELKSFGKVGSLAECMMWSRERYGYDLGLSWADLDRSPGKFVVLLGEYRQKAVT